MLSTTGSASWSSVQGSSRDSCENCSVKRKKILCILDQWRPNKDFLLWTHPEIPTCCLAFWWSCAHIHTLIGVLTVRVRHVDTPTSWSCRLLWLDGDTRDCSELGFISSSFFTLASLPSSPEQLYLFLYFSPPLPRIWVYNELWASPKA